MFNSLPDNLELAIVGGYTPTSWVRDQKLGDFHVVVFFDFSDSNCFHFAPQYNSIELLDDCFYSAVKYGERLLIGGSINSFTLSFSGEKTTKIWPSVVLKFN